MKVYIASSWKNEHGVQMLTDVLRNNGIEVHSWIENARMNVDYSNPEFDFEKWVNSESGYNVFRFDVEGIQTCDLFIYYGNGGKDASVECGIAFQANKPMIALYSKGEDMGIMRLMFSEWYKKHSDLIEFVIELSNSNRYEKFNNNPNHNHRSA